MSTRSLDVGGEIIPDVDELVLEQSIIEASFILDLEKKRVVVNLLWIKDPVQPLFEKYCGNSNIHQALRVYKSKDVKEKGRNPHKELVERDFMTNVFDLPEDLQNSTRSRIIQFSWAADIFKFLTDISKLYNLLHLDQSALPFSLFLYHNSMDGNI